MRIDDLSDQVLAFDNMDSRAKSGPFDWRQQVIVLDVPESAAFIYYGLILNGNGAAWIDDAALEVVDRKIKLTGRQFVNVEKSKGKPLDRGRPSPPAVKREQPDSADPILAGIARAQENDPVRGTSNADKQHPLNAGFEERQSVQK